MVQTEYKFIYLDQWCKTQWKYLKEKYRREKKKLNYPSGSAASFHKPWSLFEQLKFIDDHIKPTM